ncbi:MAG: hypothetical protein R6U46_02385 [Marinilabilia sp.]
MKTSAICTLIAITLTITLNAAYANDSEGKPKKETGVTLESSFLASLDIIEEEVMEVSDWMFDVEAFEADYETIEIDETWMFDVEAFRCEEEYVEVEDWMFDVTAFEAPSFVLEQWMLDEIFFEEEEVSEIDETWMFDVEAFRCEEEYIEVEDWMFDVEAFRQ